MSEFEDVTGLREAEKQEYEIFRQRLSPFFDRLNETSVAVLIWGPGKGTKFYHKREEIKKALRDHNVNDDIATSEDLFENIEHPVIVAEIDEVQLELIHAQVADVIFAIVTSDPRQSGIYMEMEKLLSSEALIHKTWVITPDRRDWPKAVAFIQLPLLKMFPEYRTKEFRMKVLEKCEQVRPFCVEKVDEVRSRKMRRMIDQMVSP